MMKKSGLIILLSLAVLSFSSCDKTRQYTRKGNRNFNKKDYKSAIDNYKEALKNDSTFSVANYNLANSLSLESSKDYTQAIEQYNKYLKNLSNKSNYSKQDSLDIAKGLYNRGNSLFALSQKDNQSEESKDYLKSAAEDYKNSILLNPQDTNAMYNYALCMWLLKSNNQNNNQDDNQNQSNSNSEINQMLEAMKNNEKNTISKVKKHEENLKTPENEKDW